MIRRGVPVCAAGGIALLALVAGSGPALASCGSANCFLVTGTQEGVNSPGEVTLDLSFRYIPQDRKLNGSRSTDDVLVPKVNFETGEIEPDHHREISTLNLLAEADLTIGLTKRVGLALGIPFFLDREHEHFDEAGTPTEHFVGDDGSTGFGDVRLSARYAALVGTKDLLVMGGGLKLPTGAYRLRDSEGGINEPSIQPGSGATDLLATLFYSHQWVPHRWEGFFSGAYQRRGENNLEYQFGNQSLLNAGVRFSPTSRSVLSLQLNGQAAPHDAYRGRLVPSTGSRQVSLTPGVTLFSSSGVGLSAHLVVPVYQKVNETQLAARPGLVLGLSATF
jgi:Putative MetA-pathway of phenol degradation